MHLHHVAITVKKLDESIAFYREHLGFAIEKEFVKKDLNGKAVFLRREDIRLELWEFGDAIENHDALDDIKIRGIRHIAFGVKDFDGTMAELRKSGLQCTDPKMGASGGRYCFTKDPNGVAIEFYESRKL